MPSTTIAYINVMRYFHGPFWMFGVEGQKEHDTDLAVELRDVFKRLFEKFIVMYHGGMENVNANAEFFCPHVRRMNSEHENSFHRSTPLHDFDKARKAFWDCDIPSGVSPKEANAMRERASADAIMTAKNKAEAYFVELQKFWDSLNDTVNSEDDVLNEVQEKCPGF